MGVPETLEATVLTAGFHELIIGLWTVGGQRN